MGYVMQYGIKKAYKNIGNIKNMAYESKTSYSFWKITGIAAAAFFVLGCICVFYKMNIICFAISEIAVICKSRKIKDLMMWMFIYIRWHIHFKEIQK